ncbi:MAG TPA: DNA-directed RNA polymerase subunit alpha C-terminal domain-containing protein, partial [Gemmatimonadales bacterium]|nr:DNA-directed RNA polymerase subunit alpha C-terminal domain-containing protein [Gemmatimonadales bacterium]
LATEHFRYFIDFGRVPQARALPAEGVAITGGLRMKLERLIDDLGLSVRTLNSLKNSNIRTLRDLVEFDEKELLEVKNVGEKAVAEIAELLQREGLRFGMAFEEVDGDLHVARSGGAAPEEPAAPEEIL